MPEYDATSFKPPAPIAIVTILSPHTGANVSDVAMLIDTGADVTLLPRERVSHLVDVDQLREHYDLQAFDGTRSTAPVVQLELQLLGKSFRGQFLLTDGEHGILGRNILNSLAITFDGPAQTWDLKR
jgi:predicted aspartyl protease